MTVADFEGPPADASDSKIPVKSGTIRSIPSPQLTVVTYGNKITTMWVNYRKSLEKWGYSYQLLGLGETWVSFMTKIQAYYNYSLRARDQELLCITDCFDVLATGPPEELVRKFFRMTEAPAIRLPGRTFTLPSRIETGHRVLVSTEKLCMGHNCVELTAWWKDKLIVPDNKYLNSGFIMGYASDLRVLLKYLLDTGHSDDQLALCLYTQQFPERIVLDSQSEVIGTIVLDFKDFECIEGRITNTITSQTPCFIHVPSVTSDCLIRFEYVGKCVLKEEFVPIGWRDKACMFITYLLKGKKKALLALLLIIGLIYRPLLIPFLLAIFLMLFLKV